MSERTFKFLLILLALGFAAFFVLTVVPPLIANPDIVGAIMAGFVNPYAAGYSTDTITCWVVLAVWVVYEASAHNVKHGWLCLLLGAVPGVATGFALYLLIRTKQRQSINI